MDKTTTTEELLLDEDVANELERWHDPIFRDRLGEILDFLGALSNAKDPNPAILHAINSSSRRRQ